MPGIDLSALSSAELKRLLAAARKRGDGPLAETVEAEIAARGAAAGRVGAALAGGSPAQALALQWDEPQDGPEAPTPTPTPEPAPAAVAISDDEPLALARPAAPPSRAAPSRALTGMAVGLVAGGLLTAGVASGVLSWREAEAPHAAPSAPRAMAALSAPASRPEPTPVASPASAVIAAPAAEPPASPPASAQTAAPAAAAAEPAPPPPRQDRRATPAPVRLAKAEPAAAERPRRLDPCARPPTSADRLVCDDLGLQELDFEARAAYARAREAHADPVILHEAQDAWRRARDETGDPRRLARLYDARIRELNEATAAARRQPPQD